MVVFLSYELSRSLAVTGWWYTFLLLGSVATAIGIEIVGILAGHTLEGYWRLGDTWRSLLAFTLLLTYTTAAVYVLRHTPTLAIVPIIAAIVYILAALADGLHATTGRQEHQAAATLQYDLERQRAEDQHRRKMEAAQLRLKHEAKLARMQTRPAKASTEPAQSQPEPAPSQQEQHACPQCGEFFGSVQAVNAHQRWCVGKQQESQSVTIGSNGRH